MRSTTTRLRGCRRWCGTSTRSGDARAGPIHSRTSTGTSVSYACPGLGTTWRGRKRKVLSESRMREICRSGSMSGCGNWVTTIKSAIQTMPSREQPPEVDSLTVMRSCAASGRTSATRQCRSHRRAGTSPGVARRAGPAWPSSGPIRPRARGASNTSCAMHATSATSRRV